MCGKISLPQDVVREDCEKRMSSLTPVHSSSLLLFLLLEEEVNLWNRWRRKREGEIEKGGEGGGCGFEFTCHSLLSSFSTFNKLLFFRPQEMRKILFEKEPYLRK